MSAFRLVYPSEDIRQGRALLAVLKAELDNRRHLSLITAEAMAVCDCPVRRAEHYRSLVDNDSHVGRLIERLHSPLYSALARLEH